MMISDKKEEKQVSKPHILVVDDDRRICDLVARYLQEHGFVVLGAKSAEDARSIMKMFSFDALVLDVMMPGQSGVEFTKDLRNEGRDIPVLLLTALSEAEDRISGFISGADDYLPKPFEPMELVLRLQSILRRIPAVDTGDRLYSFGHWVFDPNMDYIKDNNEDEIVHLTSMEANLLRALVDSVGDAVSRNELAQRCGLDAGERTIDVQVTRLRRKIEVDTKRPLYLQTVRGKGYLLRAEIL